MLLVLVASRIICSALVQDPGSASDDVDGVAAFNALFDPIETYTPGKYNSTADAEVDLVFNGYGTYRCLRVCSVTRSTHVFGMQYGLNEYILWGQVLCYPLYR